MKFRFFSFVLAVVFLCTPMMALAQSSLAVEPSPDYEVYCEGSQYQGRHDAVASGFAEVICTTNASLSFSGVSFQCSVCHQVIATENEPHSGIGKYAEWNPGYKISTYTFINVSRVNSTSGTTLPAYYFRYPYK